MILAWNLTMTSDFNKNFQYNFLWFYWQIDLIYWFLWIDTYFGSIQSVDEKKRRLQQKPNKNGHRLMWWIRRVCALFATIHFETVTKVAHGHRYRCVDSFIFICLSSARYIYCTKRRIHVYIFIVRQTINSHWYGLLSTTLTIFICLHELLRIHLFAFAHKPRERCYVMCRCRCCRLL